jgi:hypothetical protein
VAFLSLYLSEIYHRSPLRHEGKQIFHRSKDPFIYGEAACVFRWTTLIRFFHVRNNKAYQAAG